MCVRPWIVRLLAISALAILCLGLPLLAADSAVQVWDVVPAESDVRIHVGRTGAFGFAGHDHEVVAPAFFGTIRVDPGHLEQAIVDITFEAAELKVSGRGEPPQDVPEIQMTMLGPKVLDVEHYPTIGFTSRSIEPIEGDDPQAPTMFHVSGDLTLHGVTRPIDMPVSVRIDAADLLASGSVAIRQTDFGIQPVTAALGTVRVKDELAIQFKIDAEPHH